MPIITGITTGITVGIKSGINWFARLSSIVDNDTLKAATGTSFNWTNLWKGNEPSGTTTTDLIGSDDLADAATPTRNTPPSNFDEKTIEFDDGSTDRLAASGGGVADPGISNFVLLCALDSLATPAFTNRGIASKRTNSAPNIGYSLLATTSPGVRFVCESSSGITVRAVTGSEGPWTVAVVREPANNVLDLYTNHGNSTGGTFNETIAAPTKVYSIGSDNFLNVSCPFKFGLCAYAVGQANGAFTETEHDTFQSYIGL